MDGRKSSLKFHTPVLSGERPVMKLHCATIRGDQGHRGEGQSMLRGPARSVRGHLTCSARESRPAAARTPVGRRSRSV